MPIAVLKFHFEWIRFKHFSKGGRAGRNKNGKVFRMDQPRHWFMGGLTFLVSPLYV